MPCKKSIMQLLLTPLLPISNAKTITWGREYTSARVKAKHSKYACTNSGICGLNYRSKIITLSAGNSNSLNLAIKSWRHASLASPIKLNIEIDNLEKNSSSEMHPIPKVPKVPFLWSVLLLKRVLILDSTEEKAVKFLIEIKAKFHPLQPA